jgi:hypothetical protein
MVMLPGARPEANGQLGLCVGGELSTSPDMAPTVAAATVGRRSERVAVEMDATLRRRSASGVSVDILDLSTSGFRVASHLGLVKGDDVWLRLPGLEASHAQVVWTSGYMMGCRFVRPLHPAVLEMVVAKAKTR